jgi:hypothetical protein
MKPGDAAFDLAFRDFLRHMLAEAPSICQHCGRTNHEHIRAGWLDEVDHFFEDLNAN